MGKGDTFNSKQESILKKLDTVRSQREKLRRKLAASASKIDTLRCDRDNKKSALQSSRKQSEVLRSRIDILRKDRDNQKSALKACRNQLSLSRRQRDVFSDETSLILDMLCRSLPGLFHNTNFLAQLVDSARLSAKSKRFAKLKDALRNECSSIIDNSSDLNIVDSAKLVLGIINYYSGLDKGSLTYFESIQDKSILQKYAFVEYFNTILKYADTLQPPRSPIDLIKSVDEAYLCN